MFEVRICSVIGISNYDYFIHRFLLPIFRERFSRENGFEMIDANESIHFVKQMAKLYESICKISDNINSVFLIHVRCNYFYFKFNFSKRLKRFCVWIYFRYLYCFHC